MRHAPSKTRRRANLSLFQDAAGAVSLIVMLVVSLHLPSLF
ncbi:hypothetical protein [Phaeobacter sp. J2-8]|nr:hypothetical protein [Phaeobacter sp. J2-8]